MSIDYSDLQDSYVYHFYKALDCPKSLAAYLLYKYKEHEQLARLEFDPFHYNDMGRARDALAAVKFLSKAKFLSTKIDKRKVALEGFFKAEAECKIANERFQKCTFSNPYTLSVLENMKVKISRILGKFDPVEFVEACNWGPGASTLIRRSLASHPKKFDVERQVTPLCYDLVKDWFKDVYPNWEMIFEIVHSSKIVTVDKNAKTDRVIAIEPGINLWFQKGVGTMIRRRLKSIGIDLNDQGHNQRLSRLASLFNRDATVDFSAASDTIGRMLVMYCLPSNWGTIMNALRSHSGIIDGATISYEKFSSMGNGFTFELESLLFYVMADSVCYQLDVDSRGVSVYGDDVILPSSAIDMFTEVSRDLGFTVNTSKSYSSSYYRESCGSHYWNGKCIKPTFQKEPLDGKTSLLKAANNVRRLAHRRNNYGCDRSFRSCWHLFTKVLGADAPRISEGYGDIGLVVDLDDAIRSSTVVRAPNGWEGYFSRVWSLSAVQRYVDTPGLLLYKLKLVGSSRDFDPWNIADSIDAGNSIPMPGLQRFSRTRVFLPLWSDLGPWC